MEPMLLNRIIFKCVNVLLLVTAILSFQTCFAGKRIYNNYNYESMNKINEAVNNFITQNVIPGPDETMQVQVKQKSLLFKFPACTRELDVALPPNTNKEDVTSVELTCNGERPWHVYVPVDIKLTMKVLVAKRPLQPKEILSDEDIDYVSLDKRHLLSGYFKNKDEIIGQSARQFINAGAVLTKKNLEEPIIISKNQSIDIIVRKKSIMIVMKGLAKTDGRLNESIKVYNPASKRLLDAIVVGPNKAEVV